ncbi:hypothetical protein ACFQV8_09685 [Pseudonocardia benzenivorans]
MSISTPATTSTSTLGTPTAATRPLWIAAAVLTIVGLAIGLASATYAVVSAWVLVGAGCSRSPTSWYDDTARGTGSSGYAVPLRCRDDRQARRQR